MDKFSLEDISDLPTPVQMGLTSRNQGNRGFYVKLIAEGNAAHGPLTAEQVWVAAIRSGHKVKGLDSVKQRLYQLSKQNKLVRRGKGYIANIA